MDAAPPTSHYEDTNLTDKEKAAKLAKFVDTAKVFVGIVNESMEDQKDKQYEQPKLMSGGTLRDYQLRGFRWLVELHKNQMSGILADEMGLGKTVQVIALLSFLIERHHGPHLVVAPLSTVGNWRLEFKRFAPTISTVVYRGSKEDREEIRQKQLHNKLHPKSPLVIITSYQLAMNDKSHLGGGAWDVIVVDEGHRLKKHDSKLKTLMSKHYNPDACKILLTGTPLQNNLTELWSLANFVLPHMFPTAEGFLNLFNLDRCLEDEEQGGDKVLASEASMGLVSKLREVLKPFLLRRTKAEVKLRLPPKVEVVVYTGMTASQVALTRAIGDGDIRHGITSLRWTYHGEDYKPEEDPGLRQNLSNDLMQLRKVCNHPYLFAEPRRKEGQETDERIIQESGKLRVLDRMLRYLKRNGHKVLIFSQMTSVLDILQDYLDLRAPEFGEYRVLQGSTPPEDRDKAIEEFNADQGNNIFTFLLSSRAGGLGINLAAADTVVLYDSDWNPQADKQAQDRAHRIGQTRPVVVYRLITEGSVEGLILRAAERKKVLQRLVLGSPSQGSSTPIDQIRQWLRRDVQVKNGITSGGISDTELSSLLDRELVLQSVAHSEAADEHQETKEDAAESKESGTNANGNGTFHTPQKTRQGSSAWRKGARKRSGSATRGGTAGACKRQRVPAHAMPLSGPSYAIVPPRNEVSVLSALSTTQ